MGGGWWVSGHFGWWAVGGSFGRGGKGAGGECDGVGDGWWVSGALRAVGGSFGRSGEGRGARRVEGASGGGRAGLAVRPPDFRRAAGPPRYPGPLWVGRQRPPQTPAVSAWPRLPVPPAPPHPQPPPPAAPATRSPRHPQPPPPAAPATRRALHPPPIARHPPPAVKKVKKRRGWDSNPRALRPSAFKAGALNRTLPPLQNHER
jgi:hypothetical protein